MRLGIANVAVRIEIETRYCRYKQRSSVHRFLSMTWGHCVAFEDSVRATINRAIDSTNTRVESYSSWQQYCCLCLRIIMSVSTVTNFHTKRCTRTGAGIDTQKGGYICLKFVSNRQYRVAAYRYFTITTFFHIL